MSRYIIAHKADFLRPQKRGRAVYFVNEAMVDILRN